ncbi:hypothetical protein PG999_014067 [Apiospora kogelbergensis]|uniref:Major facilitator superfamily (MFS) profile domain-containing protein n=1 Tax=Apiospora kogelbergensis TaxID=1337665 RepID=A0AAW0Q907_9PEZI
MGNYFSSLDHDIRHIEEVINYDPLDPEGAVRSVIDRPGLDGFKWKVWWVAASGFFTTSYSIFATNVINPALSYVYPNCNSNTALVINMATLAGTTVGMVVFGVLADVYGRKSVYGIELCIVVIATIGMTTASTGYAGTMNIYGWIGFWRCLLGFGLGAEYPLSAVIAAEWSSTKSRAKMMAAVFLMQSVGQVAANGFGLAILVGVSKQMDIDPDGNDMRTAQIIDTAWRIIIGIAAVPALVSLFLRRLIPETPLYLAKQGQIVAATEAAGRIYAPQVSILLNEQEGPANTETLPTNPAQGMRRVRRGWFGSATTYLGGARDYLREKDRWRALLGVMIAWFLLDVAYYGLGLDSPKTISTIWLSSPPNASLTNPAPPFGYGACSTTNTSTWKSDPSQPNISIYNMLKQDSIRNIETISSGTLLGSLVILFAIDYLPRVTWMAWTFVALAGLFAINGGTFFVTFETDKHALTVTLYVLAQVLFNLGPNTMTFIVPAELFGTQYRAAFYGVAAAAGKLGAIFAQLLLKLVVFAEHPAAPAGGNGSDGANTVDDNAVWNPQWNRAKFAGLLLGFCPAMLLGAFVTWVWIPEVQFPRGHGHRSDAYRHRIARSHDHDSSGGESGDDDDDVDDDYNDNRSDDGISSGGVATEGRESRGSRRGGKGGATFRELLKLPNRPLEHIEKFPGEGQILGARRNLARLFRKRRGRGGRGVREVLPVGGAAGGGKWAGDNGRVHGKSDGF